MGFAVSSGMAYRGHAEFSGELAMESRYFPSEGQFGNTDNAHVSLLMAPKYSHSWDNDRRVLTVHPFLRLAAPDDQRSHFDLREFSFQMAWSSWDLLVGVGKVFWGVTESLHLVDIVNQTDFVENIDFEDKLGQPMVSISYLSGWGQFTGIIMPYFRERTFPGEDGRFRGNFVLDTNNAQYQSSAEVWHPDFAVRWSHFWESFEWGLHGFIGTDREPRIVPSPVDPEVLVPSYIQMWQTGLDAQMVYLDWLFKLESLYRDPDGEKGFFASVAGFEYTFANRMGGMDIGVLAEHIYDERGDGSTFGFYHHTFMGSRLAVNDEMGTEMLAGMALNNDLGQVSTLRLESTRRINDNWKWEFEANFVLNPDPNGFLNLARRDDYLQFTLSYYI